MHVVVFHDSRHGAADDTQRRQVLGESELCQVRRVCGICLNLGFCLPAFFPDPDGYWQTVRGKLFLMVAYFLTTPVEAFVQLHVLINTQRENAGSSKRIIDAGFFFTSLWVLGGFIVSEMLQEWTMTGTAACPGIDELADTDPRDLPFDPKELDKDFEAKAIQDERSAAGIPSWLRAVRIPVPTPSASSDGPTWFNLFPG